MRWIKGLVGHWERATSRRRLLNHFDAFHAAAEREGDTRLAELVELVHEFWAQGLTDDALALLHDRRRVLREQAARVRRGA